MDSAKIHSTLYTITESIDIRVKATDKNGDACRARIGKGGHAIRAGGRPFWTKE